MSELTSAAFAAWQGGNLSRAELLFRQAISLDSGDEKAHCDLVMVLYEQRRFSDALAMGASALSQFPQSAGIHCNIGVLCAAGNDFEAAIRHFSRAVELNPDDASASVNLVTARLQACDWEPLDRYRETLIAASDQGHDGRHQLETVPPFLAVQLGLSASLQRCIADFSSNRIVQLWPRMDLAPRPLARDKLRIAYLSSEFHERPTAFMIGSMMSLHDRQRFEVFAYSHGPDVNDTYRKKVRSGVDHFRDIRDLAHMDAARLIAADGIDILIDLDGHGGAGRPEIMALHPANVSVSFLGYPGTLGAGLADYVIGDDVVSPMADQALFGETIIALPGCYQPNERLAQLSSTLRRDEAGLPEHATVFCCMNASYKISQPVFDAWMDILAACPEAVLWLLESNAAAKNKLLQRARERNIEPIRIIFASHVPRGRHLDRLQLADVYLDTIGVCARAPAGDALRAGLPLLAVPGNSFSSRISTSLLTAAGLSDFICEDLAEYTDQAVRFGNNSELLAAAKFRVADAINESTVFDPYDFCRKFEDALLKIAAGEV